METAIDYIDGVVVLDFGSQYSHLITRRCRELGAYSTVLPFSCSIEEIARLNPKGIILSGGPQSVYNPDAYHSSEEFWKFCFTHNLPVLGICYGMQEMQRFFGGSIHRSAQSEYGSVLLKILKCSDPSGSFKPDVIFSGITEQCINVWMSHGDATSVLAPGFSCIASSSNTKFAAVVHPEKKLWGLQFHPEVTHSQYGQCILKNFLMQVCMCRENSWTMKRFALEKIKILRNQVANHHVIGALSGGVDSTVAAALLYKAIGSQFHGFIIDTGLLRLNEAQTVVERLRRQFPDMQVNICEAQQQFFQALKGITCPEEKRKKIGHLFIELFNEMCEKTKIAYPPGAFEGAFLLQGTLYPDVIESCSDNGLSHTIKSHHNVGGLPRDMNLKLLEPLRYLFKDEVRQLGLELDLDPDIVWRHPFPGPGLAIRILGEVTPEYVNILSHVDAIFLEELALSEFYNQVEQAFAVLLPSCRTVGVSGDQRTYGLTVCLRAVNTCDFMTADSSELPYTLLKKCSARITNEIKQITRVCYDITSKPPATIEWE